MKSDSCQKIQTLDDENSEIQILEVKVRISKNEVKSQIIEVDDMSASGNLSSPNVDLMSGQLEEDLSSNLLSSTMRSELEVDLESSEDENVDQNQ